MRRSLAVLGLVFGLVLTACSDGNGTDGSSSEGSSSIETYFADLESLVQDASKASDDLTVEIQEATQGVESEEEALAAIRAPLEKAVSAFQLALEDLEALSPPDEVADAHAAFVESTRDGTAVLVQMIEDYDALTFEELGSILQGEEFRAADEAQDRACVDLQTIADDRDIAVDLDCGDDATPTGAAEPSAEPTAGVQTYEDAEHGFSLSYPSTWGLTDPPQGLTVQVYALASAQDPIPANVNVVVEELPADLTARRYLEIGWRKLEPQLSQVEEIDSGDLTVGGLPAASMEYLAQFPGMPSVGHVYQVAIIDGRKAFVLTYVGTEENFDAYRADAESIIGSFSLG